MPLPPDSADRHGGVIAGCLERFRFIAPDPIEILHGAVGVDGLIDCLGQLLLLLGGLVDGDRHLDLDYRTGREHAEKLPTPPACGHQQGARQRHHQTGGPASFVPHAIDLEGGLADIAVDNLVAATGESGDQGAVADEVDETGDAATQAMERLDGARGKDGLYAACNLQPEADVGIHIAVRERQQVIAGGNALGQLAQRGWRSICCSSG